MFRRRKIAPLTTISGSKFTSPKITGSRQWPLLRTPAAFNLTRELKGEFETVSGAQRSTESDTARIYSTTNKLTPQLFYDQLAGLEVKVNGYEKTEQNGGCSPKDFSWSKSSKGQGVSVCSVESPQVPPPHLNVVRADGTLSLAMRVNM